MQCEIAEDETLKVNQSLWLTRVRRKSIILAASYEAREYSIHSAMRVQDATINPDIIIIEPNMSLYSHYSRLFLTIYYYETS